MGTVREGGVDLVKESDRRDCTTLSIFGRRDALSFSLELPALHRRVQLPIEACVLRLRAVSAEVAWSRPPNKGSANQYVHDNHDDPSQDGATSIRYP
jgi:hypothetical protein